MARGWWMGATIALGCGVAEREDEVWRMAALDEVSSEGSSSQGSTSEPPFEPALDLGTDKP